MFYALIAATLVVAVADWVAVAIDNRRLEHVLKPLTMVVLIGALLSMGEADPPEARWWVLAALVASLAGDVFLMLEGRFVPGLASFLVAHIFYIVAFLTMGISGAPWVLGAALVAVLIRAVGVRIVVGATDRDRAFGVPVAAYVLVISLMVAFAFGTARWPVIVGALLFYLSDACIGWSRFVREFPYQRLVIMTTYHLAQIGLVVSLLGNA